MTDVNVIMTAFIAFIAAFSFAIIYMAKALQGGDKPDGKKFIMTLIVGVIMGLIAAFSGIVPQDADLEVQYVYYMGLVTGVEGLLKVFWNLRPQAKPAA